ncbi:gliding motility protein GldL [Porphyromonas circumdentaria]|uniref:type IX secretion system motor protein PorL/GldL n=1 Tax=Porphyromonas circumdentaria TaxID=29524 RepID=UPI0026DC219C|nr:gliding motility protein GldL [Porphyromonas circumdentaria]MDO4722967.1 gliding motility protein GldL [Porphyromonas circumdentaria]
MKKSFANSKITRFLATPRGKRALNIAYSWGAAVVILGALFKLLHWSFGDEMLFVGMMTEFFVFFISGFESTEEPYKWERVYPELRRDDEMSPEELEEHRSYISERAAEAHKRVEGWERSPIYSHHTTSGNVIAANTQTPPLAEVLSEEQINELATSIGRLGKAVDQLSRLATLTTDLTHQWENLHIDSNSLEQQTKAYKEQVETLNRSLAGLSSAYEAQLRDVTGQVNAIENINRGLDRLGQMYDGCIMEGNIFRSEHSRMARQLQDLNAVYARLLDAMTVNMTISRPYDPYTPQYGTRDNYPPSRREAYPPRDEYSTPNNQQH